MRVLAIAAAVIRAPAALGNNASLYRFDALLCVPVRAVCICRLCARSPRVDFIVNASEYMVFHCIHQGCSIPCIHDNAPCNFETAFHFADHHMTCCIALLPSVPSMVTLLLE
jgi:hypothetical protein